MSGARRGTTRALLGCALLQALFGSVSAGAQVPVGPSTRELVAVNTDVERYLRVLQDLGIVPAYPWSVREFGPREIAALLPADTTHPWSARVRRTIYGSSDLYVVAPEAQAIYNSHLPFGYNDGALWAGRGITGALQGGIAGHAGPLSFTLEPIVFWAQNQSFPLIANGQSGRLSFADATNPLVIDQPQRFGDGAYSRFDLGQSTVRLDLPGVAIGASTANQQWGPAIDNPIILGNNAAGFPNVFIGTSNPLDLYAFTLQARMEWGRLDQSGFAVLQHDSTRRFMSGIVATISPRGLPNLELGGARFFHSLWTDTGLTSHDFTRPLEGFLLSSLSSIGNGTGQEPDNQLASFFGRYTVPRSGFEVYAEYGREDHNADRRDLTLEPDHDASYLFGFQKVWRRTSSHLWSVHAELLNSRISHLQLGRTQAPFYVHTPVAQGHTEEGQVLGSPAAYGGGGWTVEVNRYDRDGGWTAGWAAQDRSEFRNAEGLPDAGRSDVAHSVYVKRLVFGAWADYAVGLTLTDELNRGFTADVGNVRLDFTARPHW